MPKNAVILLLALLTPLPASAIAQGAGSLLEAPVWYLDLEVSLDGALAQSGKLENDAAWTENMTLHRVLSGVVQLDLRSPGSVIGLTMAAMKDPAAINPQTVLSQLNDMANWIEGGTDLPETEAQMQKYLADRNVSVTLKYERTRTVEGAASEMGTLYDQTVHTTVGGSGEMSIWQSIKFEMDRKAMKYWFVIPYQFPLPDGATKGTTETRTQPKSGGPVDVQTSGIDYDNFSQNLKLDTPSGMGDFPVVEGKLPATGSSISGQSAFPVHFTDGNDSVPGTLTVKYTFTQKAPAAKK
jgi:hypothetical protein